VTSAHVIEIAAPVIGLAPTFPVTTDEGTSVTPDSLKIAYDEAVLRFTVAGPEVAVVQTHTLLTKAKFVGHAHPLLLKTNGAVQVVQ